MSAIDQAFIRAYEPDDAAAVSRGPRAVMDSSRSHAPHFRLSNRKEVITPPEPTLNATATSSGAAASTSQRRPLSSFAQQTPPVEARFQPALEVDALRWSAVCDELCFKHTARWQGAIDALVAADEAGRSLVGVCGTARGAGATVATCCLARLLIHAGKTVAIIDGDFARAGLAQSLGLAADLGWEDVLAGRAPLADAVIHSLDDRLSVLPLVTGGIPAAEKLDGIHASISAGVLRYHYDLVLFDLGALGDELQEPVARRLVRRCRLDALLLVDGGTSRVPGPDALHAAAPELAAVCWGMIDNSAQAA